MVRTYMSIPGKHLLDAIELANESFGIEKTEAQKTADVESQNTQSLQQFERMMMRV